ncbi:MAG: 2-amino-4-hydroxy-6-hydroxymethyldihydropteridine diphosphokinase [Deltaproteobacteria bacterium]|nr:2-amino-4-hydroxy-6-hydroxymethyldihydropteridine diphosphokinase [Deltaproteobacteria bacterium]
MDVVLGLGSNLGDRLATLREAVVRISNIPGVVVRARSKVYETDPVGGPEQGLFLNAAVRVDAAREPLELLDALQAIERDLGRTRDVRWGPRTLDIDVLWIAGGVTIDHPRLVVPHPRLHERAFAVLPLLDVAPGAVPRVDGAVRETPHPFG